ncbi:MAG: MucR family transcriptional regulator [Pseudonocardiaceae bacterium]
MTSTAAVQVNRRAHSHTYLGHAHLWSLPDGTGLHAPYGELVAEAGTGRVCCHLCGRWYVSLGGHLRTHGHTAASYRETMGLCRSRPLVAEVLSRSIATRQSAAYQRSSELRARLAVGQEFSKTGRLASLAHTARTNGASPERARIRRAALDAGRATRAAQRDRALGRRLRELGFDDLAGYLRNAYSTGASLRSLARVTGLGWARLRREIDAAGITVRPVNTVSTRRSCAEAAIAR